MAHSCFVVIVMPCPYECVNHVAVTESYPTAAVHAHTLNPGSAVDGHMMSLDFGFELRKQR